MAKKWQEKGTPTDVKPNQDLQTQPAGTAEAQEKTAPPILVAAESGSLALTARQFVRAKGYRWERSAGFLLEQAQELGREARLTLAEWQPKWDAFWTRPVK